MVVGVRLDEGSLGAPDVLTPELRAALAEPGTVVIDAWEFATLGLKGGPYEAGEVNGQAVRLAGYLHGFHGFSFAYVFCSQETFRLLVPAAAENPDMATCLLARCRRPGGRGPGVVAPAARLSGHGGLLRATNSRSRSGTTGCFGRAAAWC